MHRTFGGVEDGPSESETPHDRLVFLAGQQQRRDETRDRFDGRSTPLLRVGSARQRVDPSGRLEALAQQRPVGPIGRLALTTPGHDVVIPGIDRSFLSVSHNDH